jgi:hypothetical protein
LAHAQPITPPRDPDLRRRLSFTEIARIHPGVFDATSGHLPLPLIEALASRLADVLPRRLVTGRDRVFCPCGSGETLLALVTIVGWPRLTAVVSRSLAPIRFRWTPLAPLIRRSVPVVSYERLMAEEDKTPGWFIDTGLDRKT